MRVALLLWIGASGGVVQDRVSTESGAPAAPAIMYEAPPFSIAPSLLDSIRFGWLEVPQDHADPSTGTLRLAVSILPALGPSRAAEPIVFIPGGPGMATVEPWTGEAARSPRIALLRERHDFVILDPRGHGLSQPRTCPELDGAAPLVDDSPAAEAIFAEKLAACRTRLEAEGVRISTLNAVQAAHDVEVLRQALGANQINLFGASYGTRIAAEVVRQHRESIRSVVFLSPVPPGVAHLSDDAEVAPEVLDGLFDRCNQNAGCRTAFPALRDDYEAVIARIRREPLVVKLPESERLPDGTIRLDERTLKEALGGLLVSRSLAGGAPIVIHALAEHGVESLAPMAPQLMRMLTDDDVAFGTNLAFHCNDAHITLESAAWISARCPRWVGEAYGAHDAAGLTSDVPALIIAGEFDPRTPPRYARQLATGLPNARVVEVPWHGHDVQHPCLSRIQRDFFAAPAAPLNTTCLDSLAPVHFARGVVLSPWISQAAMRLAGNPGQMAFAVLPAIMLAIVVVGLPLVVWRGRYQAASGRLGAEVILLWLTATTAVVLLAGTFAAIVLGASESPLIPALGVPPSWRWILWMPWAVFALATLTVLWTLRPGANRSKLSPMFRLSAIGGVAIVLALWILLSQT